MSSPTTNSSPKSVGSCRPPAPPTPPPYPAAAGPRRAPVRPQLDFTGGGDLDDDLLCRVVDGIERAYSEAKQRAPLCVCRRGECVVQQDEHGRWMYVCSSQPKCKHVALCKELDLGPKLQPAYRSHPKPSNPCVFNVPSNHMPDARTPINNIDARGAGATTSTNFSPQGAVALAPFNATMQRAGTITPVNVRPQGAGTTAVKVSPQGARSNGEGPICQCAAGKCRVLRVKNEDWYVCPIPKGRGACSHKVRVIAAGDNNTSGDEHLKDNPVESEDHGNNANKLVNRAQPDDEWPFDIINKEIVPTAQATASDKTRQESRSMLHQSTPMVKTPTKTLMPPHGTRCPMTPRSDYICF